MFTTKNIKIFWIWIYTKKSSDHCQPTNNSRYIKSFWKLYASTISLGICSILCSHTFRIKMSMLHTSHLFKIFSPFCTIIWLNSWLFQNSLNNKFLNIKPCVTVNKPHWIPKSMYNSKCFPMYNWNFLHAKWKKSWK